MKGSYLAKIIEAEQQREQRLKALYAKKNKYTEDIEGRMKCINFKEEQNSIK